MKKILLAFSMLLASCSLIACVEDTTFTTTTSTSSSTTSSQTTVTTSNVFCEIGYHDEGGQCVPDESIQTLGEVLGLDDVTIIKGHYFQTMKGIQVLTQEGEDVTYLLEVSGNVEYGTVGDYELQYSITLDDQTYTTNRTVSVVEGTYVAPTQTRPATQNGTVFLSYGSYSSGTNTTIDHPVVPTYLEKDLLSDAVPSSSWWTSLLVQNYGGSNGIYTNPLRVAYSNQGMEITNPEDGFVQFWYNNNLQTIAQFPIALKDSYLKSSTLNEGYTTQVISYGDSHVKVAMRNVGSSIDQLVTTLVQGSPYAFVESANKSTLTYTMDVNGVDDYRYFDLSGNLLSDSTYVGNAIIVEMVHRHSGYEASPPANLGAAQYSDKFYMINAPEGTTFTLSSYQHPFGKINRVSMALGDGNYLSICALNNLSEAAFYHQNAYSFVDDTFIQYEVDHQLSQVVTTFHNTIRTLREESEPTMILMPHQYKNSIASLTDYNYRTVRGTLKTMVGNSFQTVLSFDGILPGFTLPTDSSFDRDAVVSYLHSLIEQTAISDSENYLNAEGPYWNSKAIYPLAQGMIIASQLGEDQLLSDLRSNLSYLLEDWYSYTGTSDGKYLYYDNNWGSVYYSNNDFNTASELSDHSFTHGYLIFGSAVLAMYDPEFAMEYGPMVDFLLDDYLYPYRSDATFAYLRNFDPYAGHSWAHGFGTFAEGNNLESSSEALNSWNAGYLWALVQGDIDRMDASIYGFATELSAAKEYWFDYDDTNWDPVYGNVVDVAGMVWGGKFDYATWFGANPTFIYGIQWIPTGEYLTSYALDDTEYQKLSDIFATYLAAKGGVIDTWYSNMWAIEAIINPVQAIADFDATKIEGDDYPSELAGSYWMVHSLASLSRRTTDIWMGLQENVASTVYKTTEGDYVAMVWNPSTESQTVRFYNQDGLVTETTVSANSFTKVSLTQAL